MRVAEIFESIKATSKSTEKIAIMREHANNEDFKKALFYALDPFTPFYVTKVPRVKAAERENASQFSEEVSWVTFFSALRGCNERNVTGQSAIDLLYQLFLRVDVENDKWMRKILKKHLAIGVSVKTVNKVFPGLIPTFEVSLAHKFDWVRTQGHKHVAVEPKLDGIRCFSIVRNGEVQMFARSGKPITNFEKTLSPELIKLGDGCYDGELMGQDFTALMRQAYRKESVDTTGTYLALFDFLSLEEWDTKNAIMSCEDRYEELLDRLDKGGADLDLVQPVERVTVDNQYSEIKLQHDAYVKEGFEGAMIKFLDAPYRFGRGFEVMKLKAFHDVDLPISGLLEGTGKHAGKLGSFQVLFNGVEVQVGSGLTDDLREQIWADPDSFLGRVIEVRYQEVTPDGSLRFPTFVCFRNDKT